MFVNSIPLLITMYRGIKFVTDKQIPRSTTNKLSKNLKILIDLYSRGSMILQTILMDMEFDSTKDELMGRKVVKTSAAKEHVAEFERCISTVKQKFRAVESDLPFNCLYKLIVVNMVYFCILWMSVFPVKNCVPQEFSPRSIVVCTKLIWNQHLRIKFGDYAEVHDDLEPSNTFTPRTHQEITVGTTGNFNVTVNLFCLETG